MVPGKLLKSITQFRRYFAHKYVLLNLVVYTCISDIENGLGHQNPNKSQSCQKGYIHANLGKFRDLIVFGRGT